MCFKEAYPLHLIYIIFPFFLRMPAPAELHIIQVAGSWIFFFFMLSAALWVLLCKSWRETPGFCKPAISTSLFPIIYNVHIGNFWQIFNKFIFCWDERLCLWRCGCSSLPQREPIPGKSYNLRLPTASWHLPPPKKLPASVSSHPATPPRGTTTLRTQWIETCAFPGVSMISCKKGLEEWNFWRMGIKVWQHSQPLNSQWMKNIRYWMNAVHDSRNQLPFL